ncbi:cupin domain-containing protein [Thalassobius sp. I31.1]|uniref:cupin domain-containing protein n=1 Tax=Thalassobius sp. I31.1 TaxID=2109912 RepID=UPI000D198ABA|nr:cupin domain-containing protein [Thalassobius sp. I31.1]
MTDPTPTLLKAAEIDAMPGQSKTHFLNPNAQRLQKSLGDICGLTGLGVHLMEIQPGADSTEHHVHYYEDECIYVLAGQATARIGDTHETIGAGDFLGHPKNGAAHSITNTGTEPLKMLVIGQRLDHDVADYPDQGKRIFRNTSMPWDLTDITSLTTPVR